MFTTGRRWGEPSARRRPSRAAMAATWGIATASLIAVSAPAGAAVPHVVQPGETLWSIAAQSNFTTRTVAVYNGLSEDAHVVAGTTLEIPTVAEGAAALQAAGITPGSSGTPGAGAGGSAGGALAEPPPTPPPFAYATIPSPSGGVYLDAAAASAWEAMRQRALSDYGVDLYPGGPLSGYRSYAQQDYLYRLFLAGRGDPANPPGTSPHEYGIAVDLAEPEMRAVVDAIGADYCWYPHYDNEWWHVEYLCTG
jgi:LysM repeat protein